MVVVKPTEAPEHCPGPACEDGTAALTVPALKDQNTAFAEEREPGGHDREASVPTEPAGAQAAPRLSRAHGHGGRPAGAARAPGQGPEEAVGLTGPGTTPDPRAGPGGDEANRGPDRLDRLKRRREFQAVAGRGRSAAAAGLVLQARPWGDRPPPGVRGGLRYGLTASRKVGRAVRRNRARRRLRALAEEMLPRWAAARHDYVLIARGATVDRPYDELRRDLRRLLRRLGVERAAAGEARR